MKKVKLKWKNKYLISGLFRLVSRVFCYFFIFILMFKSMLKLIDLIKMNMKMKDMEMFKINIKITPDYGMHTIYV